MCNLYSVFTDRADLARMFGVTTDQTANQPPQQAVFPDQTAPVVRFAQDGTCIMQNMRWGFPPAKPGLQVVTNVRNVPSPFWRAWLKPAFRCLVPVSSFCEYDEANAKRPTWFALGADRHPFAFAGIWRPWRGPRGTKAERKAMLEQTGSEEDEHLLFSFLTCEPNSLVQPVHPKAMPVMLTTPAEWDMWLAAPAEDALKLQRPFPADRMVVVATGARQDPPKEV